MLFASVLRNMNLRCFNNTDKEEKLIIDYIIISKDVY